MSDTPFRYSLGCLLGIVTFAALLASAAIAAPGPSCQLRLLAVILIGLLFAAVILAEVVFWITERRGPNEAGREKLAALARSGPFWASIVLAMVIGLALNGVPWLALSATNREFRTAGWPCVFWERAVCFGVDEISPLDLFVDLLVLFAFASGVGISFRAGVRPVMQRTQWLFRKARNWPNDDDEPV